MKVKKLSELKKSTANNGISPIMANFHIMTANFDILMENSNVLKRWFTYCLQFPVHCPRSICGFPSTIFALFIISILCFGSRSILAMNFFIFWKLMRNECFWQGRLQTGYLSGDGRWNLNLFRRLSCSFSVCRCSRI